MYRIFQNYNQDTQQCHHPKNILCYPVLVTPSPTLTPDNHLSAPCHYRFVWFRMSSQWNHIVGNLSDFFHSARCLGESSKLCVSIVHFLLLLTSAMCGCSRLCLSISLLEDVWDVSSLGQL